MRFSPVTALTTFAVASAMFISGCDKVDEKKPASQVAAKVNSEEISVHQINNALQRTPNIPPDQAKQASTQILERLIDQELLVQRATEKKLDRDPKVMQTIEASKREILARAYLEQVAGAAAKPTQTEVSDYYAKHPELFAQRRIYNLREIAIGAKADLIPRLQEALDQAKTFNDLAAWLKNQNIPYATNASVRAAEQLPLDMLARFHQLKDGQTALVPAANAILIVHLAASQPQPLDEQKATPFIEQFLTNQKRAELAREELKQLRGKAKIEYVGDFAKADSGAPSTAAVPSPAPADVAGQPASPTIPATPDSQPPSQSHIDKGISGLK